MCATSRTTTLSSSSARPAFLIALSIFGACETPKVAAPFELEPESPAYRSAQTRLFETPGDVELLSASAAVLQDLGFHVDESVRELGYLSASKERTARERRQTVQRVVAMVFTFGMFCPTIDLHQKVGATLVVRALEAEASGGPRRQEVRVQFYRVVWRGTGYVRDQVIPPGEQRMEMIRDPDLYQQFFSRLSKSVFLEAFTL